MPEPPSDRIQPVAIDLTAVPAETPSGNPSTTRPGRRWLVPAAGVVLVTLLAVLLIAPQWILPRPAVTPPVAVAPPATSTSPPTESPYSEAELAAARREAQDILAQLLAEQKSLENSQVELWAGEAFTQARAQALEGDALYRQRDFPAALARYQEALDGLKAISANLPDHLASLMASGEQALAAGEEQLASEAFQAVLTLQPGHAQAQQGLQRATLLPQTRPLLAEARRQHAAGELEASSSTLKALLDLDPDHQEARQLLASVEETLQDRAFNQAMSDGLVALRNDRLEAAAAAFRKALAIRPGDVDASTSLSQVTHRQQARSIASQLEKARALEAGEQWQQAASLYERLKADDDTLLEARVGEIRARARAELDAGIARLLDDPLRLSAQAVYREGQRLLADARAIAEPGPRLREQTDALAKALEVSQIPVTVRLVSDNQTRVTLLRVAELGTFDEHSIDLKPGHYVAVGSRPGYRDVRVEFSVTGGTRPQVQIACKDPVS